MGIDKELLQDCTGFLQGNKKAQISINMSIRRDIRLLIDNPGRNLWYFKLTLKNLPLLKARAEFFRYLQYCHISNEQENFSESPTVAL